MSSLPLPLKSAFQKYRAVCNVIGKVVKIVILKPMSNPYIIDLCCDLKSQ